MNPIVEIHKIAKHIPLVALEDINKRIEDHMAGGGRHDDPYVYQQLRYARKFARRE